MDATATRAQVSETGEQAELARVLASSTFAKAARLCALLTYIVEQTLAVRLDELTEQQIGINVFGRTPGYNSAEDPIVRGTVRLLRQRLDLYYSEEGRRDAVRISIPKGGYVAHFGGTHPAAEPFPFPIQSSKPKGRNSKGWPASAKIAVLTLTVGVLALGLTLLRRTAAPRTQPPRGPQALWNVLFTPGRRTLLVPGDAALDAFIAWEQRPVTLAEYSNQSYLAETRVSRPPQKNDVPLAARSVTPMADLRLVSELVRVPDLMGRPDLEPWVEVRYARDVAVGDSHDNNLVLIGSETFNPWVSLYASSMDFHAEWNYKTDVYSIINKAPHMGEEAHYDYIRNAHVPPYLAYTHIALLDNSQGSGKVFIVEGTSMGTTYAAVTFLTKEELWRPVLQAATDQSGRLHDFEVLLASEFVRGGLTNTRRVALHVH